MFNNVILTDTDDDIHRNSANRETDSWRAFNPRLIQHQISTESGQSNSLQRRQWMYNNKHMQQYTLWPNWTTLTLQTHTKQNAINCTLPAGWIVSQMRRRARCMLRLQAVCCCCSCAGRLAQHSAACTCPAQPGRLLVLDGRWRWPSWCPAQAVSSRHCKSCRRNRKNEKQRRSGERSVPERQTGNGVRRLSLLVADYRPASCSSDAV